MSEWIEHEGVVVSFSKDMAQVQLEQTSACAGCHAKGACGASEKRDHVVEALTNGSHFTVGERVMVYGAKSIGFWSVVWAFAVPSALILFTLILSTLSGLSEVYGGLLGLAILIPYYIVIFLMRNRLKYKLRFYVRHI